MEILHFIISSGGISHSRLSQLLPISGHASKIECRELDETLGGKNQTTNVYSGRHALKIFMVFNRPRM